MHKFEVVWKVWIDVQKFRDEWKSYPETGHFLCIQGHFILKENSNLGGVRLLEQDSTQSLPTALLADHRQPHNRVPQIDENILVHTTDPRLVMPE